jgi:hypothetical protein
MKEALARRAASAPVFGLEVAKELVEQTEKNRAQKIATAREGPAREMWLDAKNQHLHTFLKDDVQIWTEVLQPLLRTYRQAFFISENRSSHVHAWEAAFASLYQIAMDTALVDTSSFQTGPANESSLRFAEEAIGQPKPLADSRYRVRAMCTSISIRFMMVELAQHFIEALSKRGRIVTEIHGWVPYVYLLLDTCLQDAEKATLIARTSGSHRLATETAVFFARAQLKRFAFKSFTAQITKTFMDRRKDLVNEAEATILELQKFKKATAIQHFASRPQTPDEQHWMSSTFTIPMDSIEKEWDTILHSLAMETFYQPVTDDDLKSVVAAFNFGSVGRFYRCPNGHTYVITECGGAVSRSTCPECSAPIGGGGYRLETGNTVDEELYRFAQSMHRS